MGDRARPPGQLRLAGLILARDLGSALASPWPWAAASLACLLAWAHGSAFQRGFETESLLVAADPLAGLHVAVAGVLALVHGVRLAASLAWEREHRTLELLLLAPVSMTAVIVGKFAAELLLLVAVVGLYLIYLLAVQPMGSGVIAPDDLTGAARLVLHVLPMLALGLVAAAVSGSLRRAVAVYLAAVAALVLFQAALVWLEAQPPEELSLAALWLRQSLATAAIAVDPLSPVARLADFALAAAADAAVPPARTLLAVAFTAALLAAADVLARRRGAG